MWVCIFTMLLYYVVNNHIKFLEDMLLGFALVFSMHIIVLKIYQQLTSNT